MTIAHALVVANGDLPELRIAAALAEADYVLAADGGANALIALGIVPNAVLGDFDSLTISLPESVERIDAPDQNFTDLDKAVGYLLGLGAQRITLAGATGKRLDHTFGTLCVLAKYGRRVSLTLLDNIGAAFLVDKKAEFPTVRAQIVSLLPLGPAGPITTTGLKWNLDGETLSPGVRDGISNQATGSHVTVSCGAGDLIVYVHHAL